MATIPVFDKRDQQIGWIAAVLFVGSIIALLMLMSYQIADPPPVPFVQAATTELQEIDLENLEVEVGGGSQGAPSDDPVSDPKPQTEKIITKKENPDTEVKTGEGSTTNTPKSNNEASNTQQSTNPFGSGGSSTEGSGTSVFGQDNGTSGSGPGGVGDGSGRKRLTEPKTDDIVSDANHSIVLRLKINSEGRVVSAKNIASKTTTTDQRIINQVIALVKAQVYYSKKPGASIEIKEEIINLNAS